MSATLRRGARHAVSVRSEPQWAATVARAVCSCGWLGPLRDRGKGWTDEVIVAFDGRHATPVGTR